MQLTRLIDDETEPENLGDFGSVQQARIMGALLWAAPQAQQAIRDNPDMTICCFLFRSPAYSRFYTVITDLESARQYAVDYELALLESYDGSTWRKVT